MAQGVKSPHIRHEGFGALVDSTLMPGRVRMQVDLGISIDAKPTAICHRSDRGSMFHQSGEA